MQKQKLKLIESIGFGGAAELFSEGEDWDASLEELVLRIFHMGGIEEDLKAVEAKVIMEFLVRDFHLIMAVRNVEGDKRRFCYVTEIDLLSGMTLRMLSGVLATTAVSIVASHYFDTRDMSYIAGLGTRAAESLFPEVYLKK